MTPRTINLIIAFGGVFLIGVLMLAAAWILGSAAQRRDSPDQKAPPADPQAT